MNTQSHVRCWIAPNAWQTDGDIDSGDQLEPSTSQKN